MIVSCADATPGAGRVAGIDTVVGVRTGIGADAAGIGIWRVKDDADVMGPGIWVMDKDGVNSGAEEDASFNDAEAAAAAAAPLRNPFIRCLTPPLPMFMV